jgi:hypothetical protein
MNFDLRLIVQSKQALRRRLQALPIADKLRMLDELCERTLTIAASRERRDQATESKTAQDLRNSRRV